MKTATQYITEALLIFGKHFQLPTPEPEYIEAIQDALRSKNWKTSDFIKVLNQLETDDKYAESARFGKYPMLYDYLRIKRRLDSKDFYDSLSAYLSGCWWEKENILAIATPEQSNALLAAGGLSRLYERATGETPTAVYKLVDIVAENELEAPTEVIDTSHRISKPLSFAQITNK